MNGLACTTLLMAVLAAPQGHPGMSARTEGPVAIPAAPHGAKTRASRAPKKLYPLHLCKTPRKPSPTVNGKYRGLVRKLRIPTDCKYYGPFRDYGYYTGTSYSGHNNLPAAYWVYHYPFWYLYKRQVKTQVVTPPVLVAPVQHKCQTPTNKTPSVNGKYKTQLAKLHVPRDCATYSSFRDYGFSATRAYAGQTNLPRGYWVYHYPYWYIWQSTKAPANPPPPVTPPASRCQTPKKPTADANGKYFLQLHRLHVPADCATYGSFSDYGYSSTSGYSGNANLNAGYWVYHYPYWYIWRQKRP